jgi:membrane protease YdiL (CAAX protease family)
MQLLVIVIAGFIPLFLILQFGPDLLIPSLGQFWGTLVPALVMLALALGCEMLLFTQGRPQLALRRLGYGQPGLRAIVVALLLTGIMLLFFPLVSLLTGVRFSLNTGWLLTLVSIIIFNGLGEETLFRGFVFGNLRQKSTFFRAGLISLLVFAAAHLFLFLRNPPAIAAVATLVAVTSAFPMAYLFEHGNRTIWAPVILHAGTHTIRLVTIPEAQYMTIIVAWLAMQVFIPLLVFLFRRYLQEA